MIVMASQILACTDDEPPTFEPHISPCAQCGTPFKRRTYHHRYCSATCRRQTRRARRVERPKPPKTPPVQRDCAQCGQPVPVGVSRRIYCSARCSARHHKMLARQRHAERKGGTRELKPCGTIAAVARHRYYNEPLCDACTRADNEARAKRREARKVHRHVPCGTGWPADVGGH